MCSAVKSSECKLNLSHQQLKGGKKKADDTLIITLQITQKYSTKTRHIYLRLVCCSMRAHSVMLLSSKQSPTHSPQSADVKSSVFKRLSFICCTLLLADMGNAGTLRLFHIWDSQVIARLPHVRATWLSIKRHVPAFPEFT